MLVLLTRGHQEPYLLDGILAEGPDQAGLGHRQRVEVTFVVVPVAQDDVSPMLDLGRDVFEIVIGLS